MKNTKETRLFFGLLLAGLFAVVCMYPFEAFAQVGVSAGRKMWNNIMLWVNFGIMVFIFIRYAKKPLMGYLNGVRKKIEVNIEEVGSQISAAKSIVAAEDSKLKGIDEEIRQIHERILEMAKAEKEKIIESGKVAGEKMIENAKAYAEYRLSVARKAVFDEMVDLAVSIAEERLKQGISQEDGDRLFVDFLHHLESARPSLSGKAF